MSDLPAYYQSLFAIQVTIVGLIAAGVIALWQLHERQKPRRSFTVIVPKLTIKIYFALFSLLALITGLISWSVSVGDHDLIRRYDFRTNEIAHSSVTSLTIFILTLAVVCFFLLLLWRSRTLLMPELYLNALLDKFDSKATDDSLFHSYSVKPHPYIHIMSFVARSGGKGGTSDETESPSEASTEKLRVEWDKKYARTAGSRNGLEPFVEYAKDTAKKGDGDFEVIALPLLETALFKYITGKRVDINHTNLYISDITSELNEIVPSEAIRMRKRLLDLLGKIAGHYNADLKFDECLVVSSLIYTLVKGDIPEEVKRYAVDTLREITDRYITATGDEQDWRKFVGPLHQLALIVARIGEDYYLNVKELRAVPIIEHNRGELNDLGGAFANYFAKYDELHERFNDIVPVLYFDAVDTTLKAMLHAIARSDAQIDTQGGLSYRHNEVCMSLQFVFYNYAKGAVDTRNGGLCGVALNELIGFVQLAKKLGLVKIALDIGDNLYSLGVIIACTSDLKIQYLSDDPVTKIATAINENVDLKLLLDRLPGTEHDLFEYIYKPEADRFKALLNF